jgi:isovaleryl-CoA dehydrogenase
VRQPDPPLGEPEQKRKYLPKLISGEHVGALAMSEAGPGSDVVSMKLKAEKVATATAERHQILDHQRALCRHAGRLRQDRRGQPRHHHLPDRKGHGGLLDRPEDRQDGHARLADRELVFDDCEVPDENVMGPENGGVGVLMSGLDYERTVLAGIQLGIMQACLDVVLPYVRERKQFGKPIGAFQLMQAKVADMYVALNSARAYVYRSPRPATRARPRASTRPARSCWRAKAR